MVTATRIIVTVTVAGLHHWGNPKPGVEHLGNAHRHQFLVRGEMVVAHDDRDLEFQLVAEQLRRAFVACALSPIPSGAGFVDFGSQSCEMLAKATYQHLQDHLAGSACCAIEIWEDREHGARVDFTP